MRAQLTAPALALTSRRRILGCIAGCAGTGLSISTFLGMGRAQGAGMHLLPLILELETDVLTLLDWAQWVDEMSAALKAGEAPPATPVDASFGTFGSKLDAVQDRVKAIAVLVPVALPRLPDLSSVNRDQRRQLLVQAGAPLLQAAADAGELREAAATLQRVGKNVSRQTSMLQQSSDVLRDLVPKLTAPFLDQQLTFHWVNLELVYIKKSRATETIVETKLNEVKTSQLRHAAQVKDYGGRLLSLLASEQTGLKAEQEELEREGTVLSQRQAQLDARKQALDRARAELGRLAVEVQAALADIRQESDNRDAWLTRLDSHLADIATLKEQLAWPYNKCPQGHPIETCNHTFIIANWQAQQASMRTSQAQAERSRARAEAEIDKADERLERLAQYKARTEAKAAQLRAAADRDSAVYQHDFKQLLFDAGALTTKKHRTRADVYYAESQEQTWTVERYLKAAP